jgi:ABC-type nitrate/sulfonate/bicarbonate transport system permease component
MVAGPFMSALYGTPCVAMAPLIIIWFCIGMWSKVFIVALSAFFPILINTIGGIQGIDRDLLRAARAYCATDARYLPLLRSRAPYLSFLPAFARVSLWN